MPDLHELLGLETTLTKDLASHTAIDEARALGVPGAEDGVVALAFLFGESPWDARFLRALLLLAEVLDLRLEIGRLHACLVEVHVAGDRSAREGLRGGQKLCAHELHAWIADGHARHLRHEAGLLHLQSTTVP